jgi:hypothetical protein
MDLQRFVLYAEVEAASDDLTGTFIHEDGPPFGDTEGDVA